MEPQPSTSKHTSSSFQASLERTKALYEETKAMLARISRPHKIHNKTANTSRSNTTHSLAPAPPRNINQVQSNQNQKKIVIIIRQKRPFPETLHNLPPSKITKPDLKFYSKNKNIQQPVRVPAESTNTYVKNLVGAGNSGTIYISAAKPTPQAQISEITTIANENIVVQTSKVVSTVMQQNITIYNPATQSHPETQVHNYVVPNPCDLPISLLTPSYKEYVEPNDEVEDYDNLLESLSNEEEIESKIEKPEESKTDDECLALEQSKTHDWRDLTAQDVLDFFNNLNSQQGIEDINKNLCKEYDIDHDVFDSLENLSSNGSLFMEMMQCKLCLKWGPEIALDNHYIMAHADKTYNTRISNLLIEPDINNKDPPPSSVTVYSSNGFTDLTP